MKYPYINSLVPDGEHFDETALNEGIYVSKKHFENIENKLSQSEGSESKLTAANEKIVEQSNNINSLNEKITAAEATEKTLNEKIVSLEQKVAELSAQPSGNGTSLTTAEDPIEEKPKDGKKVSILDANHPLNVEARNFLARKQAVKK